MLSAPILVGQASQPTTRVRAPGVEVTIGTTDIHRRPPSYWFRRATRLDGKDDEVVQVDTGRRPALMASLRSLENLPLPAPTIPFLDNGEMLVTAAGRRLADSDGPGIGEEGWREGGNSSPRPLPELVPPDDARGLMIRRVEFIATDDHMVDFVRTIGDAQGALAGVHAG